MTQKFMFQMIAHETGNRSEAFIGNWADVAKALGKLEHDKQQDYLLLVAIINPEDEEQMVIPKTPLLRIETFLDMYNRRENVEA